MKLFENKRNCCGCAACMNVCPAGAVKMAADEEGFEYPFIDTEKCVECGLCKKVCPVEEIRTNSKPKIGIINMQHTDNYGAVIAAAALENAVRETAGDGYEVCTVNYIPKKHFKSRFETRKDLVKLSGGLKLYVKTLFRRHSEPTDLQKRAARFAAYRKKYLHTTQVCHNPEHLAQTDRYAAFITGSDIVWAKKHADCYRAEGYYLKFAKTVKEKLPLHPVLIILSIESCLNFPGFTEKIWKVLISYLSGKPATLILYAALPTKRFITAVTRHSCPQRNIMTA